MSTQVLTGSLKREGENQLSGVFKSVGGQRKRFSARLTSNIVDFECNDAVFTGPTTGTLSLSGTIGPAKVDLKFDNGATLEGTLSPSVTPATVNGHGEWATAEPKPQADD